MAQQGDAAPRGGREEGWWQRLYDAHTTDAPGSGPGSGGAPGGAPGAGPTDGPDDPDALDDDTLDDRYASALATLGAPPPYDPEDSILPPPRDPHPSPAAYADPETYADPVAYEERPYEPPAAYEPPRGGATGATGADDPDTGAAGRGADAEPADGRAASGGVTWPRAPWARPEPPRAPEPAWDADSTPPSGTPAYSADTAPWRAHETPEPEPGRGWDRPDEPTLPITPPARETGVREPGAGAGAGADAGAGEAEVRDTAVPGSEVPGSEVKGAGARDAYGPDRDAEEPDAGVSAEAPPAPPRPGIDGVKSRESDTLDERFASILAALGGPAAPPSPLVPAPHPAPETGPAPEPRQRGQEPQGPAAAHPVTGRPLTDGRDTPPEPKPEPPVPAADHPLTDARPAPAERAPEPANPAPPVPADLAPADPAPADPAPADPVPGSATPAADREAPPAPEAAWQRPRPPAGPTAHGSGAMGPVPAAPGLPPGWAPAPEPVPEPAPEPEPVRTPTLISEPRPLDGEAGPGGVRHVGDGPPTYDPEPTAWPAAQPEALDDLVPDTLLDGARYGVLTVRAVTTRGDSARYRGRPRRDALLTARFGAGEQALLLVAVASGERGDDNAHRAAHDACRWIAAAVGRSHARLVEDMRTARRTSLRSGLGRLTDRCYGRLRARAEELGLDSTGYTAALRCLLLPADPGCRMRVCFGAGDGGLFRLRDGGWEDLDREAGTAAPAGGPGADPRGLLGGARGLGNPAARGADGDFLFRAGVAQPGDTLLLCSGGLAAPLREEPPFAAHLATRWGGTEPPGLAAFLADAQTRVKGYADDRTAVAVWDA
jgi:hypothetical protein